MISLLALADDMTGALEVSAKFASAGIPSVVSATPISAEGSAVLVLDTETRHVLPIQAAETVTRFVEQAGADRIAMIYKKTDSTLRGNIAAELDALAALFPQWRIGYAPAYPAMGRTVRQGVLYVDNVAVAETSFARDALNPVRASSLATLLSPRLPCDVFDGECDADLERTAKLILRDPSMRIAAGPSGLAGALAHELGSAGTQPVFIPTIASCLVLNGSRHERSHQQTQLLVGAGWLLLQPAAPAGMSWRETADFHAEFLLRQIATGDPDAVLIIGGDTAYAFIARLGHPLLPSCGEIVPGVPLTRVPAHLLADLLPGRSRDLLLIAKAGGFGEPDILQRVYERMTTHEC